MKIKLKSEKEFADVTLVGEDYWQSEAHKVVLWRYNSNAVKYFRKLTILLEGCQNWVGREKWC